MTTWHWKHSIFFCWLLKISSTCQSPYQSYLYCFPQVLFSKDKIYHWSQKWCNNNYRAPTNWLFCLPIPFHVRKILNYSATFLLVLLVTTRFVKRLVSKKRTFASATWWGSETLRLKRSASLFDITLLDLLLFCRKENMKCQSGFLQVPTLSL